MIDPEMKERFDRLIEVQLNERRKQIPGEISRINASAASRGMYNSSVPLVNIFELLSRETEIRVILAWESLVRVHRLFGSIMGDSLRADFKEEIKSQALIAHSELSTVLNQILEKSPIKSVNLNLDETLKASLNKHDIEIDLYFDSLEKKVIATGVSASVPHQYNFYGNVGAVQTGANSSANVVQNLGQDDKHVLVEALTQVNEALETIRDMAENKRDELMEMVKECIEISNSQNPNNTKLLTMLNVIGITVQSYASAQPAYQALKAALIPLGITLP